MLIQRRAGGGRGERPRDRRWKQRESAGS